MATKSEHHSGTDAYRYIDELIEGRDKELLIVSPYISNYYAKILIRQSKRKRIRIITSENTIKDSASLLKGMHWRALRGHYKAMFYFSILDAIVLYLNFFYIAEAITLLLALVVILTLWRAYMNGRNMQVKSTGDEFVHEKLYITDSVAITGSANLTYSGTHKNLEHIERTTDKEEIKGLKGHFRSLWNRY